MVSQDGVRGAGVGDQRSAGQSPAGEPPLVLTEDEKVLLDLLVECGDARTAAQLSSSCGLPRTQVLEALAGLAVKGLVSRFNTLVESYAARFPGLEITNQRRST